MLLESIPNELILLIVVQCAYHHETRLSCTNSKIRCIVWPEAERMRTDHRVRFRQVAHVLRCDHSFVPHGLTRAAYAIATCSETLAINSCFIGEIGVTALANALCVDRVLKELDLSYNRIGPTGATALADALRVNRVLTNLKLRWNSIGNEGAKAIGKALAVNGVLTTLSIAGNSIRDEGAVAIAEALRVNAVLTSLNVSDNDLTEEAALGICLLYTSPSPRDS